MRIELNYGGLMSGAAISGMTTDFSGLIRKTESMVDAFCAVKKQVHSMSGGVGNLRSSLDSLEARIAIEEDKVEAIKEVKRKTEDFIELTERVDGSVASLVRKNKDEFYRVNPWARPPQEEDKAWYEKVGEWLKEKADQLNEAFDALVDFAVDVASTLHKIGNSIKQWCIDHKEALIKIAIGVAVIAVSLLIPGAGTIAAAAITMAIAGTVAGGIGGAIAYATGNSDSKGGLWGAIFDGAAEGFMTGAISGAISGASYLAATKFLANPSVVKTGVDIVSAGGGELVNAFVNDGKVTKDEWGGIITSMAFAGVFSKIGGADDWFSTTSKMGDAINTFTHNVRNTVKTSANTVKLAFKDVFSGSSAKTTISTAVTDLKDLGGFLIYNNGAIATEVMAPLLPETGKEILDSIRDGAIEKVTTAIPSAVKNLTQDVVVVFPGAISALSVFH